MSTLKRVYPEARLPGCSYPLPFARACPLPSPRRQRRSPRLPALITWVGLSLLAHVFLLAGGEALWPYLKADLPEGSAVPVTLYFELPEEDEVEEEPEEEPELSGQIVDLPEPTERERPEEADYLAEHDRVVEEETRTQQYRINPEVLADTYSTDDKLKFEDLIDLNVTEQSTGAQVGNDRFDPDTNGRLASLPSPFTLTNKEGLQRPVPASTRASDLAGAPQNDLLDEKVGRSVALNTHEFIGADYMNRIRQLVNFYWRQNIDNLPPSVRLAKSEYRTVVFVVLDGNGGLESIEVTEESGAVHLDRAVVDAFRMAGPYPNPPEQLVARDGRVYLPDFGFTLTLQNARAPYRGVDPRSGVQFPGILKAPR